MAQSQRKRCDDAQCDLSCTGAAQNRCFSGGVPFSAVWIEWKTPSFAFDQRQIQEGFFKEATDIIHELSGGKQPRDRIYSNVVHTVDGTWNLNGQAMTNDQIGAALAGA